MQLLQFVYLTLAAFLEVAGDAAMRRGLTKHWLWFVPGAASLVTYGLVVNLPRWDFNKLMGIYIVIFFVVSQVIAYVAFGNRPNLSLCIGGALIVLGGVVIQRGIS
jgi:small multidrug resistance family-3 protein